MNPFDMFGSAMMFIGPVISIAFAIPIIIYIVARWRTYRDNAPPDPQLGLKVAMLFFTVQGFQTILMGLFLLVYGIFAKGESGDLMRLATALFLSGGIVFGAHFVLLGKTNHAQFPIAGRMFAGLSLVQTGVIGYFALTMAMIMLLSKGDSGEPGKMAWSATIVYCGAWALQGLKLNQQVLGGGGQFRAPAAPMAQPGGFPPGAAPPR